MSSDKSLVGGEEIDHDESIGEESEALHAELTSIHSFLSSTAERHEDGEEIIAAGLEGASAQSLPRINVYENIPFAGGDGDYSILSVLFGAHSIGEGIFGYLNMIDSNKVRVQCVECRKAVKDFPWMDAVSRITGSVKAWRAAFPCARAVNVSERYDIVDADFVHIRGDARVRLHTVNISHSIRILFPESDPSPDAVYDLLALWQRRRITDAAFMHLRGIHTLNMSLCFQDSITDAAFVHLRGIHTLDMRNCNQITDAAFVHLRGIHTLEMLYCNQETISDAAFVHLRGIHKLRMTGCDQMTITSAAFEHLRGIHTLIMWACHQITITDAAFMHLGGIHTLSMCGCYQDTITSAAFVHLRGIHKLATNGCSSAVRAAAAALLAGNPSPAP